ncbi:hypothetical protein HMPREF0239_05232 [Clostridium sp. ATCC BAA-442]|nr:hypothetical protein HMPREF0239_05232 [Clostridium sp. ATCC BAA-442]
MGKPSLSKQQGSGDASVSAPLCLLINIHFYISIHACCDRKYYITCVNKNS